MMHFNDLIRLQSGKFSPFYVHVLSSLGDDSGCSNVSSGDFHVGYGRPMCPNYALSLHPPLQANLISVSSRPLVSMLSSMSPNFPNIQLSPGKEQAKNTEKYYITSLPENKV